jgi:hypothetical protein
MPDPELKAAYDRIDELERTLTHVRDMLHDGADPFDLIETAVASIDGVLTDNTVLMI